MLMPLLGLRPSSGCPVTSMGTMHPETCIIVHTFIACIAKHIFLVYKLLTVTSATCSTTLWPINRSEILHICRRYNILALCLVHWVHILYIHHGTCSIHSRDDIWRTKINNKIYFLNLLLIFKVSLKY